MSEQSETLVVGAGSWGTALANLLAGKGVPTTIWAREPEVVESINSSHENALFLPGVPLSPELHATSDLADALGHADVIVSAVPTQFNRELWSGVAGQVPSDRPIVTVSKGIERATLLTPMQILEELGVAPDSIVALSGPSFAGEVAAGHPTAVVAAGRASTAVREVQLLFSVGPLRVYGSPDVVSAELGGALKNVIAIAVGISDGLGLGRNTRAAIITRGLAEITRLCVACGGEPLTSAGLSGMGDLVLTCTDDQSRNRRVGLAIGRGSTLDEVLAGMKEVSEGAATCLAARDLAARREVEMPITAEVCAVLYEQKDPMQAVLDLTSRELRDERW